MSKNTIYRFAIKASKEPRKSSVGKVLVTPVLGPEFEPGGEQIPGLIGWPTQPNW